MTEIFRWNWVPKMNIASFVRHLSRLFMVFHFMQQSTLCVCVCVYIFETLVPDELWSLITLLSTAKINIIFDGIEHGNVRDAVKWVKRQFILFDVRICVCVCVCVCKCKGDVWFECWRYLWAATWQSIPTNKQTNKRNRHKHFNLYRQIWTRSASI